MPPAMEPQAQLFYNVLEAIFDYADANLEPKDFGLMTFQKQKTMIEKANMPDLHAVYKIIPASVVAEQFRILECQIYMLPPDDADISPYRFREPDQPAITKAGWIKAQVISMLTDESDEAYNCLQGYINNCDLQIKDPTERARFTGGRYMPLPEKRTVVWYARSLAPRLGLKPGELEGIRQRPNAPFQAWLQTVQSQPNGVTKNEFIEEELVGEELSDEGEYEEGEEEEEEGEEEEVEEEDYDLSYMSIECDAQPPMWDV